MYIIIIGLLLLFCFALIMMRHDARQKRMERHVENALPTSIAKALTPSLLRSRQNGSVCARLVCGLLKYEPAMAGKVPALYVVLAGILAGVAVIAGLFAAGFSSSLLVWGGGSAAVLFTVRGLFGWQQHQYANLLFRQLPDTLQLVISNVRSGFPVSESFKHVASEMPYPTGDQFALVCSEIAMGRSPDEAVQGIFERTHVREYGMFTVTLAVQMTAGGRLAEVLQTLADTVRQRVTLAGRARALAGEVTFSARALTAAPFIIGGMMYFINPGSLVPLLTDPRGKMLLAYCVTSLICGTFVMRWMIRKETTI